MKYKLQTFVLSLLPFSTCAEIISSEEAFAVESDVYWHIMKEVDVKDGLIVPLLFEFTNRGLGRLKLSHGKWLPIYDCSENGGFIYEPCMMKQSLKDLNGDGFLDIYLSTQIQRPGEKESEPFTNLRKGFVELIFDPEKKEFFVGKHSSKIEAFEYYED